MSFKQSSFLTGRTLVWFSCGAASAVAAKLAVEKYGAEIGVVYCDLSGDEHEDNPRFLSDVSNWIGVEIKIIGSKKYKTTDEVFEDRRYMSGIAGAPCTEELKRVPRIAYQYAEDVHIFGYTADEKTRIATFEKNNPQLFLEWNLRDKGITKRDCYRIIKDAGIVLPAMYFLGYRNNNCKGCVKAQDIGYWKKVEKDFPNTFKRRCEQSRRLGVRLVRYKGKRIFLDEMPPGEFHYKGEDLSCGPQCKAPSLENIAA